MKLPFSFNLNFLLRTYVPGLFFSLLSFPIVSYLQKIIGFEENAGINFIFVSAIFWGILVNLLDYKIYQIFEGRTLWPKKCFEKRRKRWAKYIKSLEKRIDEAEKKHGKRSHQVRELWYKIRAFPLDEKCRYFSYFPTKLGNIIHAYEGYPGHRYGIDAIFYWYRIWFKLEKNAKNDLDGFSSKADLAVYSSFMFYCLSILYIIWMLFLLIFNIFKNSTFFADLSLKAGPPSSFFSALIIFILSLVLGIFFYHLSISLHRVYGEYFKSIFDLNKELITILNRSYTKKDYETALRVKRYLQYYRIMCPNDECGRSNPAHLEKCEDCGKKLPKIFDM